MPTHHRRVGLLGGTFDPPHWGHLASALEVRHELDLDEVRLVVANDPWQKTDRRAVTEATVRLALVRAAVAGLPGLVACDAEIRRGGPTYTADTLEELRAAEPDVVPFLVIGSDAAAGLDTWKRPDVVRDLATTVVVDRGGRQDGRPPVGWPHMVVEVPALEISSSDVRRRVAEGRPVEALVPAAVLDEVRRAGIYREAR